MRLRIHHSKRELDRPNYYPIYEIVHIKVINPDHRKLKRILEWSRGYKNE